MALDMEPLGKRVLTVPGVCEKSSDASLQALHLAHALIAALKPYLPNLRV